MMFFLRLSLSFLLLLGSFGVITPARAESDCAPPSYYESTCGAVCTQDKCQDVSFSQDGSEFQCCPPPPPPAPELPPGFGPFMLALVFMAMLYLRHKRRKPSAPAA